MTVVRLVDAKTFPVCRPDLDPDRGQSVTVHSWAAWRGKPIVIELPPEQNNSFPCDSPIVWRVAAETAELLPRDDGKRPCVCPHQIEID
jgi:hypothetical protein